MGINISKFQLISRQLIYLIIPVVAVVVVEKHIVAAEMLRRDVAAVDVDSLPVVLLVELLVLVLGPVEQLALSPAQEVVAEHRS